MNDHIERLRFFDGQQLYADDLQGIESTNRRLRWLHNRSLHQPGVGSGLAVTGRAGDREVRIQPGYALDTSGRELILTDTRIEAVPPIGGDPDGRAATFDLTVSYPSDDDLEVAETRAGVCAPRGVVRLREQPVFCWVRLRRDATGNLRPVDETQRLDIQNGEKIPLARAQVQDCRLNADLAIAVRRNARPPQRPRLGCATVQVSWSAVQPPPTAPVILDAVAETGAPLELRATIDTSAAGFRVTPCYFARVAGTRPLSVRLPAPSTKRLWLLDGPAHVLDPTPRGFVCSVPLLVYAGVFEPAFAGPIESAASESWQVTSLGVEG